MFNTEMNGLFCEQPGTINAESNGLLGGSYFSDFLERFGQSHILEQRIPSL